jgi:pimeloyl-ACP methyl ester carboxylesterase
LTVTRFATRGDLRLSYEISREPDTAPLLALHDLLVDRGQHHPLAAALAASGFRVMLPDARGHGGSPMIAGQRYPAAEMAADMLAVLDAEGLSAVQIVAAGWGANSALAMAALAPELMRSLALISRYLTAPLLDHPVAEAPQYGAAQLEAIAAAAGAASKGQTDPALDRYLGIRWGAGWRDSPCRRQSRARPGRPAADQIDRDALRAIAKPVTLLLRSHAPVFERWNAEALSLLIPGSSVQTTTIPSVEEGHAAITPDWAPVLTHVLAVDSLLDRTRQDGVGN